MSEMFKLIEINKDNIKDDKINIECPSNIYEFLLETGVYIQAKDILSQITIYHFIWR